MTCAAGLCNVTVGYNSSSAGTSKGKVNQGGRHDGDDDERGGCGGERVGTAAAAAAAVEGGVNPMVGVAVREVDADGGADIVVGCAGDCEENDPPCPVETTETGGLTIRSLTVNVQAAVTMTPSHVSKADPSSKHTKHPTVAPSPKAL
jgi:hypothetical protein